MNLLTVQKFHQSPDDYWARKETHLDFFLLITIVLLEVNVTLLHVHCWHCLIQHHHRRTNAHFICTVILVLWVWCHGVLCSTGGLWSSKCFLPRCACFFDALLFFRCLFESFSLWEHRISPFDTLLSIRSLLEAMFLWVHGIFSVVNIYLQLGLRWIGVPCYKDLSIAVNWLSRVVSFRRLLFSLLWRLKFFLAT